MMEPAAIKLAEQMKNMSEDERKQIYETNARRVFKLKV